MNQNTLEFTFCEPLNLKRLVDLDRFLADNICADLSQLFQEREGSKERYLWCGHLPVEDETDFSGIKETLEEMFLEYPHLWYLLDDIKVGVYQTSRP